MASLKRDFIDTALVKLKQIEPKLDTSMADVLLSNILYNYDIVQREEVTLPDTIWCRDDLFDFYKLYKLSVNISKGTLEQYEIAVRQLCDFVHKTLDMITEDDITRFFAVYPRLNHVSNATMENKRNCLSSVFSTLYKHGKLSKNVMASMEPIKCKSKIEDVLTDAEVERIKMACKDNPRTTCIVYVLLDTGMRVSELIGVQLRDIDMTNKTIKITGKGNKERIVPFGEKTAVRILDYIEYRRHNNHARKGEVNISLDDYLIVTDNYPYGQVSKAVVQNALKEIGKTSGVTRLHPHLLRATCATTLVQKGAPVDAVSYHLGHSDINTTMIYVRHNNEYVNQEIRKIGYVV